MKYKSLCTLCVLIILMIISTIPTYATSAVVLTETLNLRKEASTTSSIVKLLNKNDKVEVLSQEGDWYKVKYENSEGYVNKEYIKMDQEESPNTTQNTQNNTTNTEVQANTQQENDTKNVVNNQTEDTINSNEISNENVTEESSLELTNKAQADANIKILPLVNAQIISQIKKGDEIVIITKTNNWVFIQKDDITGWVPNNILQASVNSQTNNNETEITNTEVTENTTKDNTEVAQEQTVQSTKYVSKDSVYIRSEASSSSKIVSILTKNTDVKVLSTDGEWYKVTYNNITGYIRKDLLSDTKIEETSRSTTVDRTEVSNTENATTSISNVSNKGNEIVEYAKSYLGCPYVFGAAGSSSFDCSGFTMYVYNHFGYSLPHYALSQSYLGTGVEKASLMPGDLVFFLDYKSMAEIDHCGIYIGEGNFIHASSGTGYCVKISNLLSGSYSNRYATARRLI